MLKIMAIQQCVRVVRQNFNAVLCFTGIALCMTSRCTLANAQSQSATSANVMAASDKAAIQSAMAQEVKVVGTVAKIQKRGEILVCDFKGAEGTGFNAVIMERNRDAVEKRYGEGLKSIDGKRVQIAGKLAEYRDKPQIVIANPEQITLVTESKPPGEDSQTKVENRPKTIDATDKAAIDAALPHEVTVAGTVSEVKETGGNIFIDFVEAKESKFCGVVLKRNRDALEQAYGKGLKSIEGQKIQVTGEITEYRDRPEIVVSTAKQISLPNK